MIVDEVALEQSQALDQLSVWQHQLLQDSVLAYSVPSLVENGCMLAGFTL